jgi:hypothetical protein
MEVKKLKKNIVSSLRGDMMRIHFFPLKYRLRQRYSVLTCDSLPFQFPRLIRITAYHVRL